MVMAWEPACCRLLCELIDYLISVAYSCESIFKYSYNNFFLLRIFISLRQSYKSLVRIKRAYGIVTFVYFVYMIYLVSVFIEINLVANIRYCLYDT